LDIVLKRLFCSFPLTFRTYKTKKLSSNEPINDKATKPFEIHHIHAKFRSLILDHHEVLGDHQFFTKDRHGFWREQQTVASKELQFHLTLAEEQMSHWPYTDHMKMTRVHAVKQSLMPVTVHGQLVGFFVAPRIHFSLVEQVKKLQKFIANHNEQQDTLRTLGPELFTHYVDFLQKLFERFKFHSRIEEISVSSSSRLEESVIHCKQNDNKVLALFVYQKMDENEQALQEKVDFETRKTA
jgi:hypothetical protein